MQRPARRVTTYLLGSAVGAGASPAEAAAKIAALAQAWDTPGGEGWYAAREVAGSASPLPAETVPLAMADGRTLAQPQVALTDLPAFDTAAMDGWAVSGEPWEISGEVLAGSAPAVELTAGRGCDRHRRRCAWWVLRR